MVAVRFTFAKLPGLIEGLPNICGWESDIEAATVHNEPVFLSQTTLRLEDISAGFVIALHMHQPTIPAGRNGELINNLQHMFEHPYEEDNHDAGPFAYCYSRMGDFIPELVNQGCRPRVMLDYTGTLLWGFQQMGREDILNKLRRITCKSQYQPYVEWLGTFWGHTLADSVPLADIKLQIRAWQHHFASVFGMAALSRVRGFAPPEMNLPKQTEKLYAFINTLKNCGYQWMMVHEGTVQTISGEKIQHPHLPHRLVVQSASGDVADIPILIQSQKADTKLVAQMRPYDEAKTLAPVLLGNQPVPLLVSQIADGENGGRMMNEFPSAFKRAWRDMGSSGRGTVACNGTEYLELLAAAGVTTADFPSAQVVGTSAGTSAHQVGTGQRAEKGVEADGIHDRQGAVSHSSVVTQMEDLSYRFHTVMNAVADEQKHSLTQQHRYRNALLHNLLLQTSCFRSWGQGDWTDYAEEIYRRGQAILRNDF